jgi:hypothetical protein
MLRIFAMITKTCQRRKTVTYIYNVKTRTTNIMMRFQFIYKCLQRLRNVVSFWWQPFCFAAFTTTNLPWRIFVAPKFPFTALNTTSPISCLGQLTPGYITPTLPANEAVFALSVVRGAAPLAHCPSMRPRFVRTRYYTGVTADWNC